MTPEEKIAHAYLNCLDPREPRAQQVLGDLASLYHVGATSFVIGDPQQSAFREGQRSVVLYILGRVGVPLHPGAQNHG